MSQVEHVPDASHVFMRIHKNNFSKENNEILRTAFDAHGKGMSVDWDKYSRADETRNRVIPPKSPSNYAVGKMSVAKIRNCAPAQDVIHSPSASNQAHCNVVGSREMTDLEIWIQFRRICTVVIPLD